ncbi:hypothetical protein Q7P35_006601 [Cladosporium inversicolor]
MATVTLSKVGKPAIAICNRCILCLNNDLHKQPLFEILKKVKTARAAYMSAFLRDRAVSEEEIDVIDQVLGPDAPERDEEEEDDEGEGEGEDSMSE